ncbi:MAG: polysaccharide deacetylase family protein [Anaerolineales bacterium]
MKPNPILKKLGYSNDDRLVIIHTDDIGMCHASIQAYSELVEFGLISSGATMVPSSWFPQVAIYCRENSKVDMGVHLTLTSEWNTYRWSPVSTRSIDSGMIDTEGYFYRSSEETQLKGDPESVKIELQAQLDRAISAGIEVTHLDTHMNTVAHPIFVTSYIQLAIQYRLPFLFPRQDELGYRRLGMDAEIASIAANYVSYLEEQGLPLIDHAAGLELDNPFNRLDQAKQALSDLPIGITHFIIHPSKETPELMAITPDWQSRVADYRTFMDENIRKHIDNIGIQIIGYKSLKDLLSS